MAIRQYIARSASDYLYDSTGEESYSRSDKGRASDFLVAGAMAAMFFTPIGGKIMGGAFRGAKSTAMAAGKGALAAGKTALGVAKRINYKAAALGTKRAALKAYSGAKTGLRRGARVADFASRHRKGIVATIMGGAVVGGMASSLNERPTGGGPESYTRFEGGIPPDNLGATGDLTLSLHQRR